MSRAGVGLSQSCRRCFVRGAVRLLGNRTGPLCEQTPAKPGAGSVTRRLLECFRDMRGPYPAGGLGRGKSCDIHGRPTAWDQSGSCLEPFVERDALQNTPGGGRQAASGIPSHL